MSDAVTIDSPLSLAHHACAVCGAPLGVPCIPECDEDDMSDEDVAHAAIARLIANGGRWQP